ncbi:MobH family relaxase [Billgrantia endophytica]|uniref:Relaxase n=1 Tax=Billgrantia endophytica TaxID=2033802 RepID=A0A2N7U4C8_9GAMM|nr:MobH family relaxase [Halomonas endophytica]PMR75290.1 relaxase [Halomonas endophytica]
MFPLFQLKTAPPARGSRLEATPNGLTRPESAALLLATPRRQRLLEHIWQRTSLSRKQFAMLYHAPLERYAELVQQFPASESHHHAYPGGMLDHGLEIVAYALKLRQSHLLPVGAAPETQAAQAEAWTAGIAYAALLHDIGKIAVDLHVEYADGAIWHPWHGPLLQPYRFRYRKDRQYRLHGAATGLLYTDVLDREILDWLSDYPALWSALLYVLAGQYEHAGVLGELVVQADQASVAQALGGDPSKALTAPKHALQRKLLDGLRYLLRETFKLNQPEASDGWLTQDALWLVSKTVSDKLRAHLLSQGIEGIPSSNTAVFDVLQDHSIAQATPDGKAIWRATVTSPGGWSNTFTFLKLAPSLVWASMERPEPFTGTVEVEQEPSKASQAAPASDSKMADATPTRDTEPSTQPASDAGDSVDDLLDLLGMPATAPTEPIATNTTSLEVPPNHQDDPPDASHVTCSIPTTLETAATAKPSGQHFLEWLRQGIQTRKLIINDAKALVHTIADTVYLVSPGVFQRYAQEHPQIAPLAKQQQVQDWQWVQKQFERLHLHRKQPNGLNIWTCEVTGPRKSRQLHGYLLREPTGLFEEPPINNPYLTVKK